MAVADVAMIAAPAKAAARTERKYMSAPQCVVCPEFSGDGHVTLRIRPNYGTSMLAVVASAVLQQHSIFIE
jgi:hypothetical protein